MSADLYELLAKIKVDAKSAAKALRQVCDAFRGMSLAMQLSCAERELEELREDVAQDIIDGDDVNELDLLEIAVETQRVEAFKCALRLLKEGDGAD